MKGVILAGGTGSRLYPLTKISNKHVLPVGKYPMIYYPIYKLLQAGIREILIVTGKEHTGAIVNLLGNGREFDAEFTYKVQEEAGGIAQALALAETFVGTDLFTVILGDNVFSDRIGSYIDKFKEQSHGAKVLIKQVPDPQRYGVPELKNDRIVSIEEKPSLPKSTYAVTGIYMYDSRVFDIVKTVKPSGRGELEITDVNNEYIKANELTYDVLQGWWTDAGTHESLARANEWARESDYMISC
ncbi:sugar phosphate nucleotidyltransferase [Paenibacillus alkalitolerans]|uniref:sugar phosphate nucleotidyltransferase n=1 Tax=Paenibacillus alkalitolerans TaxID=2799335 RepID=UPI0018F6739C|nr:sugar phosphate nucleotidyltransferase [Paenibacillus alkalitolerans]